MRGMEDKKSLIIVAIFSILLAVGVAGSQSLYWQLPIVAGAVMLLGVAFFVFLWTDRSVLLIFVIAFLGIFGYGSRLLMVVPLVASSLCLSLVVNYQRGRIIPTMFVYGILIPAITLWVGCAIFGRGIDANILLYHALALLLMAFVVGVAESSSEIFESINVMVISGLCLWGGVEGYFHFPSRLEGPFGSATVYGAVLALFLTGDILTKIYRKMMNEYSILLWILGFFVLLLTGTRSAALAMGLLFVIAPLLSPHIPSRWARLKIVIVAFFIAGLAAMLLWYVMPDTFVIKKTFGGIDVAKNKLDGSSAGRLVAWFVAFREYSINPAFGIGIGQFPLAVSKYFSGFTLVHAHNVFIVTMVETGTYGMLHLIAMMWAGWIALGKIVDRIQRRIYIGVMLVMLFLGQFDNFPLYPSAVLFASIVVGVIIKASAQNNGS